MRIETLSAATEPAYAELLSQTPGAMLFHSLRYRSFLSRFLGPGTYDRYLLAFSSDGALVGALPAFVKENSRYGPVVNSLPFVGSNGGFLVAPGAPEDEVRRALAAAFVEMCDALGAASSTIINAPLDPQDEAYEQLTQFTTDDDRIGQITPLPSLPEGASDEVIDRSLMAMIHTKTRNVVRKAMTSDVIITHSGEPAAMRALYETHQDNMVAMGATPKPWAVFEAVMECFRYDEDYRVYIATKDGQFIGGLLVFYFNRIAEYFTPVTVAASRIFQPQSLICLHAMREGIKRRCTHWNWGGTGKSQTGVYQFKSRWGTTDFRYRYFVRERDDRILRTLDAKTLLEEYPYFYAIPFHNLITAKDPR